MRSHLVLVLLGLILWDTQGQTQPSQVQLVPLNWETVDYEVSVAGGLLPCSCGHL